MNYTDTGTAIWPGFGNFIFPFRRATMKRKVKSGNREKIRVFFWRVPGKVKSLLYPSMHYKVLILLGVPPADFPTC